MAGGSKCVSLTTFQFGLGYSLVFGSVFLAYLPQWVKILRQRSHAGLSLTNFCCAAFSTLLSLLSIVADTLIDVLSCCKHEGTRPCMSAAQPLIQQIVTTGSAHLVVLFYFLNFSSVWSREQGRDPAVEWAFTQRSCAVLVGVGSLCSIVCMALFLSPERRGLHDFSRAAATVNGLLVSCHWGFQIRETHAAKCAGSLSLFSLFMMFVGSFVVSE